MPATIASPAQAIARRDAQVRLIRTGILLVAALLRMTGVAYGFPLLVHPDEFVIVGGVADMAARNSFEPPWSYRPDHVEMKVDYGVFAAYAGAVEGTSVEDAYAENRLPFYLLARLVTAAFGVGTVLLAYLAGAQLSRRLGLVAAALFAVFPPFVLHAHYATPDVPLTFAVMLLVCALMRYAVSTSWRSLLTASFAVALAIGIKYPGAVGAVLIATMVAAAAIRDRAWRRLLAHGAGSAVAAVGFLFVISPTLFTNLGGVRAELRRQSVGDRLGHPDLGLGGNLWFYVEGFLRPAGLLLGAFAAIGLVFVVTQRRLDIVPWFVGLPIWVALSTLPLTWERWGLPMWVTPLLLAAMGITVALERLWATRGRWVLAAAIGVAAAHLGLGTVRVDAALVATDARVTARSWVDDRSITADESAFEGYTPFLPGDYYLFTDQARRTGDGYEFLTKTGERAKYVVLSELMYARVRVDPAYRDTQRLYDYVVTHFDEIARFEGIEHEWHPFEPVAIVREVRAIAAYAGGDDSGPTIRVFEVPDSGPRASRQPGSPPASG